MRRRTEALIVVLAILICAAAVGQLDERYIGQQDATYVSLRDLFNEWRSRQ